MSYSAESLYEVMANILKEEMSKTFWGDSEERISMIISYAIDDKHYELYYDKKEDAMIYRYLTPFGGLIVDISSTLIMDYNIDSKEDDYHWEFFGKIASLFLEDNMCEVDKYFYNEIKSGNLKLDWRGFTKVTLSEEEQKYLEDKLKKYFGKE
jgi:hypothetical protein